METKAREMQLTTRSSGPSKQEEIKILLAKLAIRRQAKVGELEFMVFSEDLMPYETRDIQLALESLSSRPRDEGETAFPDTAKILEAVRGVIRSRKPPKPSGVEKWDDYLKRVKAERGE